MANVDVTRILGNIGALNSLNSLQNINNQLSIHQTRLATGKRINEASEDPAGNSLATTFDVRRQALGTALKSIGDSKNLMATAEGGLKKIQDILVKMSNKALEAQGDTIGADERSAIKAQLQSFASEIDDIVKETKWNNTNLLSAAGGTGSTTKLNFLTGPTAGSAGLSSFEFTVGSGIKANQGFQATSGSGATGLGLDTAALGITDTASASSAADKISSALGVVKEAISQVGSFTARLTFKEEALTIQHANTESAYNRIMSANMAEEQVNASKYAILQQTATAMLAQANMAPQFLLSLFR